MVRIIAQSEAEDGGEELKHAGPAVDTKNILIVSSFHLTQISFTVIHPHPNCTIQIY
jgi:hypothetical protein